MRAGHYWAKIRAFVALAATCMRRLVRTYWAATSLTVALALVFVLVATPFFLSPTSVYSNDQNDSSLIRSLALELEQIKNRISELQTEKSSLAQELNTKTTECVRLVVDADVHKVDYTKQPDCGKRQKGDSRNPYLNALQLFWANDAIDKLQSVYTTIASKQRRIEELEKKREEVETKYDAAIVARTQERVSQVELLVVLLRYASIGAIGAIGFNIILRLGVYNGASRASVAPSNKVRTISYLIGSMYVAAILAVIFVSRLAGISASSSLQALTPLGISIALAAGLIGDVALRALRKIFEGPSGQ